MQWKKINEREVNHEFVRAFSLFDHENTGAITLRNLKCVADELGVGLTETELQEMIDLAGGEGGEGGINIKQFLHIMDLFA